MLASSKDGSPDPLEFSLASDIVELIVLTVDEVFLQTLRGAVGSSRRLWHVPSPDKVSDLLVAGQVGILVLDVLALHETAGVFVSQIKRQFPDLVVVVAGDRGAETLLANLISLGLVYRFIHKPMSPARARLFADAAVRRYEEQRDRAVRALRQPPAKPLGRRWLIVAGCCCLVVVAAGAWLLQQRSREERSLTHPETAGPQRADLQLLTRAAAALAANRLSPPAVDNALELYLQALARNPSDTAAHAGLTEVHERLLARAENALLEERLDEAAAAIQTARRAGVESGRIAFLTAQLARSRSLVRAAAPSTTKADAAAEAPGGVLADALSRAAARIEEGRLLEPDRDNARYYVQRALALAPNSAAAAAAEESLAIALVAATHSAIERRDFPRAASTLDAARGVASSTNVDHLEQLLRAAEAAVTDHSAADASAVPTGAAPAADVAQVLQPPQEGKNAPSDVMGAEQLTTVKSIRPTYPSKAEADGTEGWVELEFTVTEKGQVKDIAVRGASPPGVFDSAAMTALAQWRFRPIERDSRPVAQRARMRIRFTLGA